MNEIKEAIAEIRHTKQFYVSKKNFDLAILALEKQLSNSWVPVIERLPKEGGQYSIYVTIRYIESGNIYSAKMRWSYGEFTWFNGRSLSSDCEIIAWMHETMPEPYREVAK